MALPISQTPFHFELSLSSLNNQKGPLNMGAFYFRITFSDPIRIGRTQIPNHAFGVLRITFSDPIRIGRTQIPNHAFGVCGLFYLFAFECKLSTLTNKKALNTSC
jgi:hypothetical protein